ncbi:hypothetical protein EST38_g3286 [Candolleomyces aberdarensis]|uniref:Uncharacterized protein n=1 Tax=Candolleomyces aberdarensis TaxID=2316362 RepID=A0A4Q2DUJ4_9AGAR|nr:hypothetical protein EST38_g3286 [Candolleomyces aberdarensis]
MPKDSSRPSLPTSSSDFALPPSSSPGGSFNSVDDPNFLFHQESESERERMSTDSPCSSENHTPPLKSDNNEEDAAPAKPKASKTPLTPPRRRSSAASMDSDMPTIFNRRLNFPLKQPRLLKILAEPRPEEDEVKSEAAFQRLLHSSSELPRTPRPVIDRGRYPEEAGHEEETQREATPSDDELELDDTPFAYSAPSGTQPINIRGMRTPGGSAANSVAGSVAGSVNGDELTGMSISEASSSNGYMPMDVDMVRNVLGIEFNADRHAKLMEVYTAADRGPSCALKQTKT